MTRRSRLLRPLLVLLGAAAAVVVGALLTHHLLRRDSSEGAGPADGFVERAGESGIDFRMSFLPGEQGQKLIKVNIYDHGSGVAVADYDGDGHDDVYFCNQLGKNGLYRNKGDGTFEDVTDRAGVGLGDRVCVGATFADTLNTGRQDLFVTSTRGGNVFFRNMGDGTFKDVTREAGLDREPATHSSTAVFFDYDNDGLLDLFVTNTAQWTLNYKDPQSHYFPGRPKFLDMATSPREHNVLYHNNGDGTFTDVTAKAGLAGKGWGGDVAVFDYDGDGHMDLFVTNMFGASQLYHNNGDGTFTDVTKEVLGATPFGAIGSKVLDFNNDGRLDLYVVDMHSDMWPPLGLSPRHPTDNLRTKYRHFMGPYYERDAGARAVEQSLMDAIKFRYDDVVFGNTLFKNMGPGKKFEEVSDKAGMETWWPWGIATGDFDNDGFEDVFIPSGMGYPYDYSPSALMMNNGNETFTDRAKDFGIDPPPGGEYLEERVAGEPATRSSRCAATADFDGDGRLDLVVNNFNDRAYYFRNHFPKRNYVAFRLTGTTYQRAGGGRKTSRDAIGALVTLHVREEVMTRQVQGAGGYLSQSSRTIHFGLGDRKKIDRVEVRWPGDPKNVQVIANPEINQLHEVREPDTR